MGGWRSRVLNLGVVFSYASSSTPAYRTWGQKSLQWGSKGPLGGVMISSGPILMTFVTVAAKIALPGTGVESKIWPKSDF